MNSMTIRATRLLQQRRADLAEIELHRVLGENPTDDHAHGLLALCKVQQGKVSEAEAAAKQAVHYGPGNPSAHYALSVALMAAKKLRAAREAIDHALSLAPDDADLHAVRASLFLQAQQWDEALDAANRGLRVEPEHVDCINARASALTKLGRSAEAQESIDRALRENPNDPDTHANRGWTLLHQNRPGDALPHFREALRLDPEHDWARSGLVEALKARNPIYRLVLAFFLWMAGLSGRARMGVVIGGYLAYRVVAGVARNQPDLAPILWPIMAAYIVFVLLTWVAVPMFNLFLLTNPYGRYALSATERLRSVVFGAMLMSALTLWVIGLATGGHGWHIAALVVAVTTLPAMTVFAGTMPQRLIRAGCVILIALLGIAAAIGQFMPAQPNAEGEASGDTLLGLWLLSVFIYLAATSLLGMRRPDV